MTEVYNQVVMLCWQGLGTTHIHRLFMTYILITNLELFSDYACSYRKLFSFLLSCEAISAFMTVLSFPDFTRHFSSSLAETVDSVVVAILNQ